MQGHKKKFRKSLWLGMVFNGEWGTETPIALTTTTTFTTTTALSPTTTFSTTTALRNTTTWTRSSTSTRSSVGRCGPRHGGIGCPDGMFCSYLGYCISVTKDWKKP